MPERFFFVVLTALGLASAVVARADEELEQHLASLKRQVDDNSRPLSVRAQLALEMTATLDRAAQNATTAEERRAIWQRAIGLLDDFTRLNPGQPLADELDAQAAIYLWARGVDYAREAEFSPDGKALREHAMKELDASIGRLQKVTEAVGAPTDSFPQNVRFRLAQAVFDRAALLEGDAEARDKQERRALEVLTPPITEAELQGYARLLRAQVLAALGRFLEALGEVDAAAKSTPSPGRDEVIEVRTTVLIGLKQYAEALEALRKADVDKRLQASLRALVRLEQRAHAGSDSAREAIDTDLFRALGQLRGSGRLQARRTLMKAAREIETPGDEVSADGWEALADGALALGNLKRAGALDARAAERAETDGNTTQAQALRLKAGAILYEAGDFAGADAFLSRVFADPGAGKLRVKAGLLRALARGRALALGRPEANRESYETALKELIREFPKDPLASEGRWLLGQLSLAIAQPDDARAQWMAISPGSPRWLESRLGVARLAQEELDRLEVVNDREQIRQKEQVARRFLTDSRDQARTAPEKAEIDLALARLDVTAYVAKADDARAICERIATSAVTPELLGRARLLLLRAFAELNRFVDAERIAHEQIAEVAHEELIETVRWLDHAAMNSDSELRRRRCGLLMRVLLRPVLEHLEDVSPALGWEARLRHARALLFTGDDRGAKKALAEVANLPPGASDDDYKDLAETYFGLEAYELAIDVQRLRARRGRTGSVAWFDARYGLALAYYRAGREHEARQLIDATSILHPELGGGELREKFIRLRQRLNGE